MTLSQRAIEAAARAIIKERQEWSDREGPFGVYYLPYNVARQHAVRDFRPGAKAKIVARFDTHEEAMAECAILTEQYFLTAALAVDGLCLVDQREEQPSDLRLGDRVRVSMRRRKLMYETEPFWRGQIVGETRDGNGWVVRRDLYKTPVAYHKSFCSKEGPAASDGESPPAGTEG